MAKKDFKTAFKNINKLIVKVQVKKNMEDIGDEAIKMVTKRTLLGYGSIKGRKHKLRPLSDAYKAWRKKYKGKIPLSSKTTPKKSHLTLTGDMLSEMYSVPYRGKVLIDFLSDFSQDKARWNTDNGRPFMDLTRQERKRISDYVQQIIDKIIRKS